MASTTYSCISAGKTCLAGTPKWLCHRSIDLSQTRYNILVNELKAGKVALKLAYEEAKRLDFPKDFSARLYFGDKAVI
jgi:hypothetical protein